MLERIEHHLPQQFGLKRGAEEFPLMVVVAMTYVCNARCVHCPYTNSDIRRSYSDARFIDSAIFKKVADECGQYGARVRLTGGGEPLLHPQILMLIDYARKAKASVGLITNGALLDPTIADKLLAIGVDSIEFSVDAADPETYAKIRVGLDYARVKRNILYSVRKRDQLKSDTVIVASVVEQKANMDRLQDITSYWGGIVDNVQIRKYLTWNILNEQNAGDPTPYYKDRPPCPHPFERLNIDTRGKILFCGFDIAGTTDFGNVKETTIKDVWTGEKFAVWRRLILERQFDKIDLCRKCMDWRYKSWTYNYWKLIKDSERTSRQ